MENVLPISKTTLQIKSESPKTASVYILRSTSSGRQRADLNICAYASVFRTNKKLIRANSTQVTAKLIREAALCSLVTPTVTTHITKPKTFVFISRISKRWNVSSTAAKNRNHRVEFRRSCCTSKVWQKLNRCSEVLSCWAWMRRRLYK